MNNRLLHRFIMLILAGTILNSATAQAASFSVGWSGASQGNSAFAHGTLTVDDRFFPASSSLTWLTPGTEITDFQLEVSGTGSGDGIFQLSDFTAFTWSTTATESTPVSLDLTQELVGQPTLGGAWGSTHDAEASTGDFNLIAIDPAYAPSLAGASFTMSTRNGYKLELVSFAPAVPEPEEWAMLMFGIPFTGWIAHRKRIA